MELLIAKSAGFCFGVSRAIDTAYHEIEKNKKIYTYGPLIHNKQVTADLKKKGIDVIESLEGVEEGTIIIRSHGVGKTLYDAIEKKGLKVVDGTCPFVKRIHNIVEKAFEQKKQIMIIGSAVHPEVQGINGWCDNSAVILQEIEQAEDLTALENKKYTVVVQTTFRKSKFEYIIKILQKKGLELEVFDTICSATEQRQQEAVLISQKVDKMIVIGDKNSSNTQKLVEICKKIVKKHITLKQFVI